MVDIGKKIEITKQQIELNPKDKKLQSELKRLIVELNDRVKLCQIHNIEDEPSSTPSQQPDMLGEKIDFHSELLNEGFYWDVDGGRAVFESGVIYTEKEVRDIHQQRVDNTTLINLHRLKKAFPQLRYIRTVDETQEEIQQEDELDLLFKDLKG